MSGFCPCSLGNSVSAALGNLKKAKRLNPEQPNQTASASVLSRRVIRRNEMYENDPWAYLVIFRLEDGREVELEVPESTYGTLKEGLEGTLVWQQKDLIAFP